MSTATLLPQWPRKFQPDEQSIPKKEIHRRLRLLGISQNELARQIGRDPGLVSRVIRRRLVSRPIWRQIHRFFDKAGMPYKRDGHAAA